MSYRFAPGEAVEAGIKRMAREQVDKALTEINTRQFSHQRRGHQVRKRCKKVRALARLVRPVLGDQYAEINAQFRDLARTLSDLRDAHALVEAFDAVTADAREALQVSRVGIETWHVETQGFDAVSVGLGKTYRRAREAMAAAQGNPTAERDHE